MPAPPAPPKKKAGPKMPRAVKAPSVQQKPTREVKKFAVQPWTGEGEGEKVVVYSESGGGKSTLASMAPNPIFIAPDSGARKLTRPDGSPLTHIPGIECWDDLRDAVNQHDLFEPGSTLVLDTLTRIEADWCIPHILATVKTDKGGTAKFIERYGFGKGWQYVLDHFRLLFCDLDRLAATGVNILLLCQQSAITIANAEGTDYLQNGPKLTHTKSSSVRLEVQEWADHVFRIGHLNTNVTAGVDDRVGKISDDTTRVIFTAGARHFVAKSRPLANRESLPSEVSFEDPTDDSLWTYIFGETQ